MLIGKNTKELEILNYLNINKFYGDFIDDLNNLKKIYKYFQIDTNGNIIVAQKKKNIIINSKLIKQYHINEIDVKRNFVINIRKIKLENILN